MSDLLLDVLSGDLAVVDGDLVLIPTVQQLVRQQVQITLNTFRGEWNYNINYGVPYVANENSDIQILDKVDKAFFDLNIREAITSVEGIIEITSYSSTLNFASQIVNITFEASTESGSISDSISINI